MGKLIPHSSSFDYGALTKADARELREIAARNRERLYQLTSTVFEIGRDLLAVEERLGWGKFEAWCDLEFGRSSRLARHCKAVVERLGDNSEIFSDLPRTVLYKLASPSIPQEVLDSVITRVQSGAPVTLKYIKELVAAYRGDAAPEEQHEPADDESWTLERAVRTVSPVFNLDNKLKGVPDLFWFTGRTVMAYAFFGTPYTYNVLAIEAPFEGDVRGGVSGRLAPFLKGTLGRFELVNGKEVGEARLVSSGLDEECTIITPLLSFEHQAFRFPSLPEPTARFDGAFPAAIRKVLRMQPSGGVAVVPARDRLSLYSTHLTAALATIPLPAGWNEKPMFLPREFCKQLVSFFQEGGELFFTTVATLSDHCPAIVAVSPSGVRLCSLLQSDAEPRPLQLPDMEPIYLDVDTRAVFTLLIAEAQRRQRMAESAGRGFEEYQKGVVNVAIDGEAMRMWIGAEENPSIEVRIALGSSHPNMQAQFDAEMLQRGLGACDVVTVSDRFIAMTSSDGSAYLVPRIVREEQPADVSDVVLDQDTETDELPAAEAAR